METSKIKKKRKKKKDKTEMVENAQHIYFMSRAVSIQLGKKMSHTLNVILIFYQQSMNRT